MKNGNLSKNIDWEFSKSFLKVIVTDFMNERKNFKMKVERRIRSEEDVEINGNFEEENTRLKENC